MKRSTDRFLTTHTGSLPRPDDLIRMMYAKEEGVPVDPARARRARPRGGRGDRARSRPTPASTSSTTARCRKPSYATYVKDRLAGFGGTGNTFVYQDLADFPELQQQRVRRSRAAHAARRRPATRRSPCATRTRRRPTSTT